MLQVSAVLDRKEALLMQLRNMNDEAEAGLHLDNTGRHTEAFQVQYAQIVLELKQVCSPAQPAFCAAGQPVIHPFPDRILASRTCIPFLSGVGGRISFWGAAGCNGMERTMLE